MAKNIDTVVIGNAAGTLALRGVQGPTGLTGTTNDPASVEVNVKPNEEAEVDKVDSGTKIVVPIYPNFSQSKGLILLLTVFCLSIGLPAGWFGVNQDVVRVTHSSDGAYYIMYVEEKPGFIRGWFRDGGPAVYVRRTDGEETNWYTYPDSRPVMFSSSYEEMFNGWAVEQAVNKNQPIEIDLPDEND